MSGLYLVILSIFGLLGQYSGQLSKDGSSATLNVGNIESYTLSDSEQCKVDVRKHCVKTGAARLSNMKVLKCIDDLDDAVNLISKECQNLIYSYKYNLTHDTSFDDAAKRFCAVDLKHLEECNKIAKERRAGHLVSCLYDALQNITEINCRNFIDQMQLITFTDWRLSESFSDACFGDITKYKCGRLDDENNTLPHEQGFVLSCLAKHLSKLSGNCSKEIARMTEMQSNDYHLDRALYAACREDRGRLCATITPGNGRVYRCLYEQKFNSLMSAACRKEIHRRQKVVVENPLLDAPLVRACKGEAAEHQCFPTKTNGTNYSLLDLLICLEQKMLKDKDFNEECKKEMLVHRRMLMTDYKLSSEVFLQCKHDAIARCSQYAHQVSSAALDSRGGKMIHCLLRAIRDVQNRNVSKQCVTAINKLIVAVNPGRDIRTDPSLESHCQPVINALCPRIKPGEENVVLCLMENLKNPRMTEDCEDHLLDLAYFMQRDWRITPGFVRSCQKNLIDLCEFPKDWKMTGNFTDYQKSDYLACLHQKRSQLDAECQSSLKRLMLIRSQSVDLMPEIEDNCIDDLATCLKNNVRGEEMKCLQDKYFDLKDQCRQAVKKYTSLAMANPTLDFYLMKACELIIQSSCRESDLESESRLLQCLIKQKNHPKMDLRCQASINHHQLTSLKDKAFLSQQFQNACQAEINEHCAARTKKATVVQCLADILLVDKLKGENNIKAACREELKFELFQRSENIAMDPLLQQVCSKDIQNLCSSFKSGNGQVLECLKKNFYNVSAECRTRLIKRMKIDVILPTNDFSLVSKCTAPIQKFCSNTKENLLLCLMRRVKSEKFPSECQQIIYRRLMVFNSDARFNKGLIDNCKVDIDKFCKDVMFDEDPKDESEETGADLEFLKDPELGGRVIGCLRHQYANGQKELTPACITELTDVIEMSKLSVQIDAKLYRNCRKTLQANCPGDDKEDCLKLLYQRNQIADAACKQEVIRIIREGQADVHVDYAVSFACQADINKLCSNTPLGNARQLLCLLKNKKSTSKECQAILTKREELWRKVPDVNDVKRLAWHVINSENRHQLLAIFVVGTMAIFLFGYFCRSRVGYQRLSKYK